MKYYQTNSRYAAAFSLGTRGADGVTIGRLVRSIQHVNPAARIYLLGLYNPYRRSPLAAWIDTQVSLWDGGLIQKLASNRGVTVVRIADLLAREDRISLTDRFHPGSHGDSAILVASRRRSEARATPCATTESF